MHNKEGGIVKVQNVVPSKLHQELIDSGIECSVSHNLEDGRYFIGECEIKLAEGTDMELVQQIIDAHIPTVLPVSKTDIELIKLSQANQFETILEILGGLM